MLTSRLTFSDPHAVFQKHVGLTYRRKMLKGCWEELGRKGWVWRAEIRVDRFSKPENHEHRVFDSCKVKMDSTDEDSIRIYVRTL